MTDETTRLSGTDTAWWRMGGRTNRTEITGVVTFEEPIEYETVRERCEERVLPFDRFRQRLVDPGPGRRPRWELDGEFDLDNHLHHVALPEPQDRETFQAFVGTVMSQPVDREKPLWQAYLVEGVGDGNALVVSIHHALADGFALLFVMLWLADDPNAIDLPIGTMPSPPDHVDVPVPDESGDGTESAAADLPSADPSEWSLPTDPGALWETAKRGFRGTKAALGLLAMDDEPATPLTGDLTVRKRVAWTDPIDLDRVKVIANACDATVNDVVLAATAGALRRQLEREGEPVDRDLTLRVTVPLNLKPLEARTEALGNYFGLGYVPLPVGVENVDERLARLQADTGYLRQGSEAYLVYLLLGVLGRLPAPLQERALGIVRGKATAVVTNVPGPTDSFAVGGTPVDDVMFWVPQANGIGLGLSVFTYDDHLRVGVAADDGLLAEPFELASAFAAEIDALEAAVAEDDRDSRTETRART